MVALAVLLLLWCMRQCWMMRSVERAWNFAIRNPAPKKAAGPAEPSCYHCALEATPVQVPLQPAPRSMTWIRRDR